VFRALALVVCTASLSGCFTLGYLAQATAGQLDLIRRGKPIATVVNDPSQPRRTRYLLAQVKRIKAWGQTRGLKPTENYKRYSDLERAAAVWVVQGCAPLKFEPRRWEFAIVGTVPYLGFFKEDEARRYAAQLEKDEKLDVTVRGAQAYSTLGWFNDPVLSTMLGTGPDAVGELAETILHESVHATVYVQGQSSFDESLASVVAEGLTPEWLAQTYGPDSPTTRAYLEGQERSERFVRELHQTYEQLDAVYRSAVTDEAKRRQKETLLADLSARLGTRRVFNNATLAGFKTYGSGKEGFAHLKAACGTWEKVLAAVATLKPSDFAKPQQEAFDPVLDRLAHKQCASRAQ
jgi:predicted aminopeptidase